MLEDPNNMEMKALHISEKNGNKTSRTIGIHKCSIFDVNRFYPSGQFSVAREVSNMMCIDRLNSNAVKFDLELERNPDSNSILSIEVYPCKPEQISRERTAVHMGCLTDKRDPLAVNYRMALSENYLENAYLRVIYNKIEPYPKLTQICKEKRFPFVSIRPSSTTVNIVNNHHWMDKSANFKVKPTLKQDLSFTFD